MPDEEHRKAHLRRRPDRCYRLHCPARGCAREARCPPRPADEAEHRGQEAHEDPAGERGSQGSDGGRDDRPRRSPDHQGADDPDGPESP